MSRIRTQVKKGDTVEVITGNHKGKRGTVLSVDVGNGRVIVEGVRQLRKAVRPSEADPNGGIKTIDGPIHISNVRNTG